MNSDHARTIHVFKTQNTQAVSAAKKAFTTTRDKMGGANNKARETILAIFWRFRANINFAK
jgi:hypothetical protein